MGIAVQIVEEDLNTVISYHEGIEIDDDFYHLRNIARQLECKFLATIDDAGDTVINRLQLPYIEEEIMKIRSHSDVNKTILDNLQIAINIVKKHGPHVYIKFIGD